MGDLREPNGVIWEESVVTLSSSSSVSSAAGRKVWSRAEVATQEIIRQVQPTVVSEERRRDVLDYVQRLLKGYLGCEVFPFGSVPLKTYLPDGDIDLTAFCGFNFEEAFASEVYSVLEAEDRNPAAKFVVKDVQYIRAEVKLVKCLVQNIVVDISFNQIGGLCALGFLEEIDRLIGKDHLFKRSIILIKAWCYYESRILGAHHGLISTYALETLVLYIFHLFHSSLNGPLAVLHKFLDYFSQFDWENLCVSLSGPVHVNSLPEIVVERPETSGREVLLSDDFMRECVRKFSVPSRGVETNYRTFMQKHLNIVDPLKENNNLGRSVSKGNFFRIRSAFSYGARKLGQILFQSPENVSEEVRKFFANTLERHGNGQRPDVQDHLQLSSPNRFNSEMLLPFDGPYRDQINPHEKNSVDCDNQSSESRVTFENAHVRLGNFREDVTNIEGAISEHKEGFKELAGDANELAISNFQDLRISDQGDEFCPSELLGNKKSLSVDLPSPRHHYFSHSLENGKMENGHLDEEQHKDSSLTHLESNGFLTWEQNSSQLRNDDGHLRGRHEIVNLLPDLSGDVDCHLDNLHYGQWLYDQGLAMPIQQPIHLVQPSMFQPNVSWDPLHQTVQLRQDVVPQMSVNGVIQRPTFFPSNSPAARGLGTYFPIVNHHSYRDRSSPKGRYQGQLKSPRVNGRGPMLFDRILPTQVPVRQGIGRPKFYDYHESSSMGKIYRETNGFVQACENPLPEIETCGALDPDPSEGNPIVEPPVIVFNNSRLSDKFYQLKDDEDFPPLSS
ncbi:uncharacterized protein LOC141653596 [Silene latifolia]|uniref:uncharacterized protein LOC141653596 n=1 Tax=Silene latifolia TaxID=37657 RepID=UPI003D785588